MAHPTRLAQPADCRGFTLLEVLVAMVLSVTLLVVLWGLAGTYADLFETGQARSEQSQLARSLLGQLADDLRSAIEDSPTRHPAADASAAAAVSPVRRFGLLGTQRSLRFDVLQVIPLEQTPDLNTDVSETFWGSMTSQVPELRTVYYSFRNPDEQREFAQADAPEGDWDGRPGLTRRELDFETPYDEEEASPGGRSSPPTDVSSIGDLATTAAGDASEELLDELAQDESITWAPEVVGLQFRYFDGSSWSGQWDSLQRKSLPTAIEVTMQVRSYDEAQQEGLFAEQVAAEAEETESGISPDGGKTGQQPRDDSSRPTYRLVIDLPSAQTHPALRKPAPRTTAMAEIPRPATPGPLRAPGPLTVKRIIPKPAGAPPSAPKPDQWIRTGP
ncbi:MAG: prepilin-type N-terminal cleavage/methylation domain-containing protein [Pirellulales bacterium]|nr:prepilin-type N-terminal cleavage/methylation domain-containing protein [Pirellulales bacterium]